MNTVHRVSLLLFGSKTPWRKCAATFKALGVKTGLLCKVSPLIYFQNVQGYV